MKTVLLLRTRDEGGLDRYEGAFEAEGYVPVSVPVLETAFVHLDELKARIVRGPDAEGLGGVILTSKRAVEAWCEALRLMAISGPETTTDWRTVPFYVVGGATGHAASEVHRAFASMGHLAPADVRGGAEAGTGERLAEYMLREGQEGRRMLYLTGDKNRETLPGMLTARGTALETLVVYRTAASSTLRADLVGAVGEHGGGAWGWVVHFAPSAAETTTPVLREVFGEGGMRVAAIGPTTASHLRDALGVRVDVVAPRPTPDALCTAVAAFDRVDGFRA